MPKTEAVWPVMDLGLLPARQITPFPPLDQATGYANPLCQSARIPINSCERQM